MKEEKYVRFCLAKHVAVSVSFSSFYSLAFLFLGAWKCNQENFSFLLKMKSMWAESAEVEGARI